MEKIYDALDLMIGKTFSRVECLENREIIFECEDGGQFRMFHRQDCCEYVRVEEIIGDLQDLVGSPILMVEEVSNDSDSEDNKVCYGSYTWTFYKFATQKGYVTIRWLGESNGYYSESVDVVYSC